MEITPHWNGSTLLITARKVKVARGERLLAEGLDFDLSAGEAILLQGENGSGKSTLLRMIAHLLPLAGGSVQMPFLPQGNDEACAHIHYIGHKDGLKDALTVMENAHLWARLLGGSCGQEKVLEALDTVGLMRVSGLGAGLLSAGQRRRLALARLILVPRPVWLLDEPATALDSKGLALLDRLVAAHRQQGGGVIAATHSPLAWRHCRSMAMEDYAVSCAGDAT